jgi:hypothetical protein
MSYQQYLFEIGEKASKPSLVNSGAVGWKAQNHPLSEPFSRFLHQFFQKFRACMVPRFQTGGAKKAIDFPGPVAIEGVGRSKSAELEPLP